MTRDGRIMEEDHRVMTPRSAVAVAVAGRGRPDVHSFLCHIAGTLKTEKLGIEKMIATVLLRPWVRQLVVRGREGLGHFQARAPISLCRDGVDDDMGIIGAKAPMSSLCNTPPEAAKMFRAKVELHDLIHPKDFDEMVEYDPVYDLEESSRQELPRPLECLRERDDPPFGEPMRYSAPLLFADGDDLLRGMHRGAYRIANGMLGMASEGLSTTAPSVVGDIPGVISEPAKGVMEEAASVGPSERMRHCLTGGF